MDPKVPDYCTLNGTLAFLMQMNIIRVMVMVMMSMMMLTMVMMKIRLDVEWLVLDHYRGGRRYCRTQDNENNQKGTRTENKTPERMMARIGDDGDDGQDLVDIKNKKVMRSCHSVFVLLYSKIYSTSLWDSPEEKQ